MATEPLASLATALADGSVRVVDLTQPLSESTPVLQLPPPFANTPGLSREDISRFDDLGPAWAWSTLTVGEHVGTHFDAPIHWITGRDGEDVASAPPSKLVAPAAVIDKSAEAAADPNYLLTLADIQALGERARPAARPAAGCSCAPAGTPAPTTRRRSSTAPRPPARTPRPRAGWPRPRRSSASAWRPSAPTRAPPTPSTRPSRSTTSCSAPASTASPSWRTSPSCPPQGAIVVVAPLKLVDGTGSPSRVFALV